MQPATCYIPHRGGGTVYPTPQTSRHCIVYFPCHGCTPHTVSKGLLSLPFVYSSACRAVKADVLLLNEIGLDPGIDHCSAISLVSKLHAERKQVVSFTSFCGGLPAPDVPHGPLRYKFSWSPRGVLTAALNSAKYRLGDKVGI